MITADGRKLAVHAGDPISLGARVLTGPDAHLQILLLDETVFSLGPNADLVLDEFAYDPDALKVPRKIVATVFKGVFRWVPGKVARARPENMKVNLAAGAIGIRGTDFGVTMHPDDSGGLELFSGSLKITERKTGRVFPLDGGNKVTFTAGGVFSQPVALKEPTGVGN